jgi:hypothetical protein
MIRTDDVVQYRTGRSLAVQVGTVTKVHGRSVELYGGEWIQHREIIAIVRHLGHSMPSLTSIAAAVMHGEVAGENTNQGNDGGEEED